MAHRVRMTLDQAVSRPGTVDRAKVEATTEEDVRRQMIEDGEDPDAGVGDEDVISPAAIRKRLGMTQQRFAEAIRVPVRTLRNWEQNRVAMDPSTVSLMTILAREPETALRALGRKRA